MSSEAPAFSPEIEAAIRTVREDVARLHGELVRYDLIVWTGGWSLAGWKIGGGLAGFLGWGLLPIVSVALRAPHTENILILLLSALLIGRRMQGNPGDEMDTASMMPSTCPVPNFSRSFENRFEMA